MLRNTLGVVQSLYVFLEASPKRHALFVNTKSSSENLFIRTLKSLSKTRWSAHYESVKAVDEEIERIIKCLYLIVQECDAKSSSEAKALLGSVLDFEFIFGLSILKIILPNTSKLNSFIQSYTIYVRKVRHNANLTIQTLESCRNEDDFELIWQKTSIICDKIKTLLDLEEIDSDFKDPKLPRHKPSKRRQVLMGESSSGHIEFSDLKSYHRINHFYPSLDKIIIELKNRFAENDQNILCALGSLIFDKNIEEDTFKIVSEFYKLDIELLKADHKLFCHFKVMLIYDVDFIHNIIFRILVFPIMLQLQKSSNFFTKMKQYQ